MRHLGICFRRWMLAVAIGIFAVPAALAESSQERFDRETLYSEARQRIAARQFESAYAMLAPREFDYAGREGYDYLLGVAALESGRPGDAIFAFQRLLSVRPDFAGARLDFARAFYQIGDLERAKIEFEKVLLEDPPMGVRATVDTYLVAIEEGAARAEPSNFQTYFDFAAGYDSNPVAATDEEVFLGFTLDPRNLEQDSAFQLTTLGALWTKPVSEKSAFLLNGRFDHRANPSAHFVDTTNLDLGIAYSWIPGRNTFTVAANTVYSMLDSDYHRNDVALTAAWTNQLNDRFMANAFLRAADIAFEDEALQVRDIRQEMAGLGLTLMSDIGDISVTLISGEDDPEQVDSPFANEMEGYSLGYIRRFAGGSNFFMSYGFTEVEFEQPFFGFAREDETRTAAVGVMLTNFPARRWESTLRLTNTEKESTVSLYEFTRYEFAVSFRRAFQ